MNAAARHKFSAERCSLIRTTFYGKVCSASTSFYGKECSGVRSFTERPARFSGSPRRPAWYLYQSMPGVFLEEGLGDAVGVTDLDSSYHGDTVSSLEKDRFSVD